MAVLSLIFSELSNFVAVTLTVRSFFKASCTFSVRVMNVFCFLLDNLPMVFVLPSSTLILYKSSAFFPGMDCFEALSLSMSF